MFKTGEEVSRWQSLLTETLPYEVPVIFSNDRLFAGLIGRMADPKVSSAIKRMMDKTTDYTIPYTYSIRKDTEGYTTLGLIHPALQVRASAFIRDYSQTMIELCSRSEFSIRRPTGITSALSANPIEKGEQLKLGIPHVDPSDGEFDVSHISSYFTYARYNLLSKFVDSIEFSKLEMKYASLTTTDISRCFSHIYTHSLTWAAKSKEFSKAEHKRYSFESAFDQLMQKCNYNETNGIVVGPELSRVFAEIILQHVDVSIQRRLSPDLIHNRDYAVRRYVDDYYIFAHSRETASRIRAVIASELEKFKLFLNEKKTQSFERPFVSSISLARSEIATLVGDVRVLLASATPGVQPETITEVRKSMSARLRDIRLIVAKYDIGLHPLSGWLLSTLRSLVRTIVDWSHAPPNAAILELYAELLESIVRVVFYIVSLDTRVRSTYMLCQIVILADRFGAGADFDYQDRIRHLLSEELVALIAQTDSSEIGRSDECVELYNLLIIGAFIGGADIISSRPFVSALDRVLGNTPMRYFAYATAKFCYSRDMVLSAKLDELNGRAKEQLLKGAGDVGLKAEVFLLACDYLASADIPADDRREVFKALFGGDNLANKHLAEIGARIGFSDFEGFHIEHLLQRRELRPVYSFG